jgi:hypothetical protein
MGCCFAKSSAPPKEEQCEVDTVPRVSFPVVVTNPVSTTNGSSPSTCSTVSTSSSEDESKEDGTFAARRVLDRMLQRWRAANAENGKDTATAPGLSTPRPGLRAPTSSGTDGSDSDPWDVVPGGGL